MTTLELGIRMQQEKGIAFFGVEEVNQRIAGGARIIEIRPAGAIVTRVGEGEGNVTVMLSGCQFEVVFEDA